MKNIIIILLLAFSTPVYAETACDATVENLSKKLEDDQLKVEKPIYKQNIITVVAKADHEILEPTTSILRNGQYQRTYTYTHVDRGPDSEKGSECFANGLTVTFKPVGKNIEEITEYNGAQCLILSAEYRQYSTTKPLAMSDKARKFGRACDRMFLR